MVERVGTSSERLRELAVRWERRADVLHANHLRARKAGDLNGAAALANLCSEARKCARELTAIVGPAEPRAEGGKDDA